MRRGSKGRNHSSGGRFRLEISPAAAIVLGALIAADRSSTLFTLLPAAVAHEAGHLLLLWRFRNIPLKLRLSLTGLELHYQGELERREALACLLAGPVAGIIYAVAVSVVPRVFWQRSALQSYLLSVFNLLPILPLDGGRIVSALSDEDFSYAVSRRMSLLLLLLSLILCHRHFDPALLWMPVWLTFCSFNRRRY